MEIIRREATYLWYFFSIQFNQIIWYWVAGILIGSLVSVFAKEKINWLFASIKDRKWGLLGLIPASLLGIASPLCMYGTIPIAASFSEQGMREDWLAAFMMSSILLNPQLIVYSTSLGATVLVVRIVTCFLMGISAGLLVHFFFRKKPFFNFDGFRRYQNRDTDPRVLVRLLSNIWRNVKSTGFYFLVGIVISAVFQRYVPEEVFARLFGSQRDLGVFLGATIGVPMYACGGGTIPLLQTWLFGGMSIGSAAAFMLTGPATKITNLSALKNILGIRNFLLYFIYCWAFAVISGLTVNLIL